MVRFDIDSFSSEKPMLAPEFTEKIRLAPKFFLCLVPTVKTYSKQTGNDFFS